MPPRPHSENHPVSSVGRSDHEPRQVELIGAVTGPGGNGPTNGMFALQQALRERIADGLDWISIEPQVRSADVLPWFWCWEHRTQAVAWASEELPFAQGPNVLFINSRRPRIDAQESAMLDAGCCRAMFCHSEWYRDLIWAHRGADNRSPIELWPYPIEPKPGAPLTAEFDLLLYLKSGYNAAFVESLTRAFPRHVKVQYGAFRREQLAELARRARACAYLCVDESGGLALAEILLAGCPAVGVRTGAPFVQDGHTGYLVDRLRTAGHSELDVVVQQAFVEAIRAAQTLDRDAVRVAALQQFSTERIVDQVLAALDAARRSA